MDYQNFDSEDFIKDEYFIRWVKDSDESSNVFWKDWIAQHPDKESIVKEAKLLVQAIDFDIPPPNEKRLNSILNNIHQEIAIKEPAPKRSNVFWIRRLAAAIIIGMTIWGAYTFRKATPENYLTAYGEKEKINLPDGSAVILNANSSIKISDVWEKNKNREVWLEGEAYFSVSSQPIAGGNKFVVHAGSLDVEVLGTEFNVNNRKKEVTVVLENGKVNLQHTNKDKGHKKSLMMKPGERVFFAAKDFEKTMVDPKIYTSWIDDVLLLNNTSLDYLIKILEDNYGYQVELENQNLREETLSGTTIKKDPEILINGIGAALQLKVKRDGKKIFIGR